MKKLGLVLLCLIIGATAFASGSGGGEEPQEVTFWYHLDDPETTADALIAKFEEENPGITIEPEKVPWDSFHQKLLTSIAGGVPPNVTTSKLWWQPQLVEMGALLPLDEYIAGWDGKDDIFDNIWDLTKYTDGVQYYMPLRMVILYMYYRTDMFEELGLEIPTTREEFLATAKALTRDTDGDGNIDVYGFGIRGARGGHDWWGTFVLSSGAQFFDANGNSGLTTPDAIAANQWFIDLYRVHGVSPPTTPTDGFKEIIANMQSGRTAMTIHHLGSSKGLDEVLGEKLSAAPVPRGSQGAWTSFGDGGSFILQGTEDPDAAFKWISFLSTAENNAVWQEYTGEVSVNKSNAANVSNRFLKATTDSADFAGVMPAHPATAEFVESLWPTLMQRAFLGEISSAEMMQAIEDHFAK